MAEGTSPLRSARGARAAWARLVACALLLASGGVLCGVAAGQDGRRRLLSDSLASPNQVRQDVKVHLGRDPEGGATLARGLADEGGPAAAEGLALLARHRDPAVREAAFLGATVLQLRHGGLREAAVAALVPYAGARPGERQAALKALAVVGDGRDVPRLIELLRDREPGIAALARQALVRLMGVGPLVRHPERLEAWWAGVLARAGPELDLALDTLERTPDPTARRAARALLGLKGLQDLGRVTARLHAWFAAGPPELRAEAAALVGEFRLAPLAREVAALAATGAGAAADAARAALARLGVPVPGRDADPD